MKMLESFTRETSEYEDGSKSALDANLSAVVISIHMIFTNKI